MQVTFGNMNGEVQVVFVPETHAELKALLAEHEHEAFCPDCEATLDDCEENLCPCCGEGIGAEPEFVRVRKAEDTEPLNPEGDRGPNYLPDPDLDF
jgi:predicted amidophosphoribosyltransferase